MTSKMLFSKILLTTQVVIILFLFLFGKWDTSKQYESSEYIIFRDIMVMLLLGFGYLMTFLSKNGLGAVGFTMMITVVAIEINLILEPLLSFTASLNSLGLSNLIDCEFNAATVLISYGAIIGRVTPTQLLLMTIIESIFYTVNKLWFVFGLFHAEDVGGSVTIHMFGAYFGLAVSKVLGPPNVTTVHNSMPTPLSDIISLVGTTLLWVYWPSFVGATETLTPLYEQYCILHTVMALLGSTSATFYMSYLLSKDNKFNPVHIANSTLAGGVAIGSCARLPIGPVNSFLVGTIVGCISVYGYTTISPKIMESNVLQIYDTCGIHNLHGLPSIVGGIASIFFVVFYSQSVEFLYHSWGIVQAFFQCCAIITTILFAIGTGTITGMIMKKYIDHNGSDESFVEYDDSMWWDCEYFENENEHHEVSIKNNGSTTNVVDHANESTPLSTATA